MREGETKQKTDATRGRPREFNEDKVMAALLNLFWTHGYEGTSLSDIMEATGLKKGSLYSLFGGKRDMYLKALTRYDRDYVANACRMIADRASGTAAQRLDKFRSLPIDALHVQKDDRGCFLCNASAEMAAHDDDMRDFVQRCYDDMMVALMPTIKALWPDEDAPQITARARLIVTVYSGLRIMSRSGLPRDVMEDVKQAALHFSP